ncbi:hypothetical protein [Streptomyces sp. SID13031]|uniref:hypothetical protein n=1 Tax=Streptomyces sp. SID13031 TaxID=2706046 RepID=UPI0013CB3EBB|nr:hypothetical protein [Streptomyces sp. SID13031]NEA37356.1 hypothetical protein [Streptomyces sp. SID13031]
MTEVPRGASLTDVIPRDVADILACGVQRPRWLGPARTGLLCALVATTLVPSRLPRPDLSRSHSVAGSVEVLAAALAPEALIDLIGASGSDVDLVLTGFGMIFRTAAGAGTSKEGQP